MKCGIKVYMPIFTYDILPSPSAWCVHASLLRWTSRIAPFNAINIIIIIILCWLSAVLHQCKVFTLYFSRCHGTVTKCNLKVSVSKNSSVGSVLGSRSCVMQHCRFDLPSYEPLVEEIFPLELTWVLTPFPKTLLDESINRGLVCAHMHSIARTPKILTFMS